jgi:hypothetical protein
MNEDEVQETWYSVSEVENACTILRNILHEASKNAVGRVHVVINPQGVILAVYSNTESAYTHANSINGARVLSESIRSTYDK